MSRAINGCLKKHPLVAVVLGVLAVFAVEYFAAPHLDARIQQQIHHGRTA